MEDLPTMAAGCAASRVCVFSLHLHDHSANKIEQPMYKSGNVSGLLIRPSAHLTFIPESVRPLALADVRGAAGMNSPQQHQGTSPLHMANEHTAGRAHADLARQRNAV